MLLPDTGQRYLSTPLGRHPSRHDAGRGRDLALDAELADNRGRQIGEPR